MLYYTKNHIYVRIDGNIGCLGISEYAASILGPISSFRGPQFGAWIEEGDIIATIELNSEDLTIRSALTGEVVEANGILDKRPELINSSPEGEGWLTKLRIAAWPDTSRLMNRRQYKNLQYKNLLEANFCSADRSGSS